MNKYLLIIILTFGFSQQDISTKQFVFFNNNNRNIDFRKLITDFNGKYLVELISVDDVQYDRTKKIMIEQCDLKFKISNKKSEIDISRCGDIMTYDGVIIVDNNLSSASIEYSKYKNLSCMLTFWISGRFLSIENDDEIHKDGLMNEYYENGKLKIEYKYKNGKKHGIQKRWYENGQLEIIYNYEYGKLQGLQQKWHSNGILKGEWYYNNDKLHGIIKEWYNNNIIKFIKKYDNGSLMEVIETNNIDGSSF